jgi:hypothetical protein
MAQGHVQKYTSGKHLLKALTDNPELPAFVPTLPASGLKTLINEVGLHDAGALIEYSTPAQLTTLIDDAVWKSPSPGAPDKFDRDEFREWLTALLEIGDEFAVERLQALDEDLLVMAMMGFLEIVDLEKQMVTASKTVSQDFVLWETAVDNKELYGPFEVKPRNEHEWETIQPLLTALNVVDFDFLQALLTRCCLPESMVTFRDEQTATHDAAGAHRQRREQQGFVASETAGAFLNNARDEDLAVLAAASEYDIDTQDYFKRALRAALDEATGSSTNRQLRLSHDAAADTDSGGDDEPPPDPERMGELEALVAQVELEALSAPVQRLAGPGDQGPIMNPLQVALKQLAAEQPEGLSQRMSEAAYLSNLLMTGTRIEADALSHKESVAAVMATCNLGYEFAPEFDLTKEPGLVGVFRIGWHLVQRVPVEVVERLRKTLALDEVRNRSGARAWIVEDVLAAISTEEVDADLEASRFENVRESLQLLSLLVEDHVLEHIERLVDHLPTTMEASDGNRIRLRRRFIEHETDIADMQQFLDDLPNQIAQ